MKILRLTAENVKKLRAVQIEPDGALVQVTGANGSGKSSVLDAIYYALAGGRMPRQPIRRGEESARIQLDLGEIIVTRKFTAGGSSVVVEAATGARFPTPQRMLDGLIGAISFDPLAFTRLEPKAQYDLLRRLVPLEVDIDALDGLNKADYEKRTEINRDAAKLRGQASGIQYPVDLPDERIDVDSLTRALAKAGDDNATLTLRRERREQAATHIAELRAEADLVEHGIEATIKDLMRVADAGRQRYDQLIAELERQIEIVRLERTDHVTASEGAIVARRRSLEDGAAELRQKADGLEAQIKQASPLSDPTDTEHLVRQIDEASRINGWIEARERRATIEAEAEALERRSAALTEALEGRATAKKEAIEKAEMPVEGLSFGSGELLFHDLPLDQASQAELIRLSMAIAMAVNPKLRVICIKEGSLLDESSMRMIAEMAAAADYQCWIECVDTSGQVGIVMEDGAIAAAHSLPGAAEQRQPSLV